MSLKDFASGVPGQPPPPRGFPPARPGAPGLGAAPRWFRALGEDPTPVAIQGIPSPISGPAPNRDTFRVIQIPTGTRGTTATLKEMAKLSVEAAADPYFVSYFRQVVDGCAARDYRCVAQTLLSWVKDNVIYTNDPVYCELCQSPGYTAFVAGRGDCDDMSILLAGCLLACGIANVNFKAVATERSNPTEFSHVLVSVGLPDDEGRIKWVGADPVMDPNGPAVLGQEPPRSAYVMNPNLLPVQPY